MSEKVHSKSTPRWSSSKNNVFGEIITEIEFLFYCISISIDNEAPVISSTSSQNAYTDTGSSMVEVSWPLPTASDNSGEGVTLTSDYSPGDSFPTGNTTVTYTATDVYGNVATSSFEVKVSG